MKNYSKYICLGEDLKDPKQNLFELSAMGITMDMVFRAHLIFWYDTKKEIIHYFKNRYEGISQRPMSKVEWLLFRLKYGV